MSEIGTPAIPVTLKEGDIAKAFNDAYALKKQYVQPRVNRIAQLVNPAYWWREENTPPDQDMGQIRQVVGMFGLASIRGTILDTTFPVGENPIRLELHANGNLEQDDPLLEKSNTYLDRQAFLLWGAAGSARANNRAFASGRGFMASMSIAIDFALVHGDVCVWGQKDFLFEVMRPEQWAAVRDGQGNELALYCRRKVDSATLNWDAWVAANLPPGYTQRPIHQRMVWIFTEYKFKDGKWRQTDECNGNVIFTDAHDEARIFTMPWQLIPGDQHGRSFFEIVYAKMAELDLLCRIKSDLSMQAGDSKILIDRNSTIRPSRLLGQSGTFITGANIQQGKQQDAAILSYEKHEDYRQVREEARSLESELAKALGIELDLLPNGERVTRYQVVEVATRINRMTGGQMIAFQETLTNKTVRCLVDIARETGTFERIPDDIKDLIADFFQVRMTAGVAAMARQQTVQKTMTWSQVAQTIATAQLPEDLDKTRIIMDLGRDIGLNTAKWQLSAQEVAARQQNAINKQVEAQAALETVKATAPVVAQQGLAQ